MMKRVLLILLLLALAVGVWYFSSRVPGNIAASTTVNSSGGPAMAPRKPGPGTEAPAPGSNPPPPIGEATSAPSAGSATASAAPLPATPFLLGSADTPPEMDPATVLNNMRITINQYGSMFGGNPVGTNPEITRALNGDNPKQVRFIKEDSGLRINGRGELVDYWGTPFFFHQLSGTVMEIHSAGPDKLMWTTDDLVTQ